MKILLTLSVPVFAFLSACDQIDAVGDKVNELKDFRKQATRGLDGMDLSNILDGQVVRDLKQGDFESFISQPGKLNIVDFHADWCPPCRQLGPILSQAVEENSDVARLGKVNVDNAKMLSQSQGVSSIPDVRFYVDGQMVHRFVGGESPAVVERLIAEHSASLPRSDGFAANADPQSADNAGGRVPLPASASQASSAAPIEETMQPMKKDWMPPGVNHK